MAVLSDLLHIIKAIRFKLLARQQTFWAKSKDLSIESVRKYAKTLPENSISMLPISSIPEATIPFPRKIRAN